MATNPKGQGSYSDRSKFLVQAPHFFKVVLFPFDQGLKIPDAFMRNYGGDLQDIVLLKVPTGASWQVELVHYGNGTWLQKGWQEFAEYYTIKKLHFLVFRYEGNSQFHVLVFDPTAVEIEYPFETNSDRSGGLSRTFSDEFLINTPAGQSSSSCIGKKLNDANDDDDEEEEIFVEILKNYPTTRSSKGKRARVEDIQEDVSIEILDDLSEWKPKPKPRPRPRTRSSNRLMTENLNVVKVDTNPYLHTKSNGNKKEKQNQNENSGCSKQQTKKEESFVGTKRPLRSPISISNCKRVIAKEKFISYQKAKAFRSSKPFFVSFMQPSYVSDCFCLMIPSNFLKDYLTTKNKCKYMLHVSGKTGRWPVILHVSGRRGKTGCGWKKFVHDNSLKVGDTCVFELVTGARKFNITVYRSAEHETVA